MKAPVSIQYCPSCGASSFIRHGEKDWRCNHCGFIYFHNAAATVSGILRCNDDILLTVRKYDPSKGLCDLPGGFVDYDETLEQALAREMQEELKFVLKDWRYFSSGFNRYCYEGVNYRTSDAFFIQELSAKPGLVPGDDVEDVVWVQLDAIDFDKLAFESVKQVVRLLQESN